MLELTEKQKQVLQIISDYTMEFAYPPTLQELANRLGVRSINSVVKHIQALEKKGFIEKDSASARGLRVVHTQVVDTNVESDTGIPLIGRVAAGRPILAEQHIESRITVPQHLIRPGRQYYALRVRGDSMIEAGIHNQDVVVVEYQQTAHPEDIIVALIDEEATVKRLKKSGQQFYLKAENPDYSDIYPSADWSIQGKVVGLVRDQIR